MSKYYLLKYSGKYEDSISITGHVVLTVEEYAIFKKALDDAPEEFDFFINQHESIAYYEEQNSFDYGIDVKEITENDYVNLKRLDMIEFGYARAFTQAVVIAANGKGYKESDHDDEPSDDPFVWDTIVLAE
jgi:hypothetical protein